MEKTMSKSLTTLLIVAIIFGIIPAIRAAPPTPPAIWIVAETLNFNAATTNVGDKFNVTIWTSTTQAVYTWQVKVTFNTTQLNAVRADYTGIGKSMFFTGHATSPVAPVIDNASATGSVLHGESLIGADPGVPAGTGTLFWIEFQIMTVPSAGSLTSLLDTNLPSDTYLLDPNLDTIQGVNLGHATYIIIASGPPPARHDVAVTGLTFSNAQPKQGDSITINVTVLNNGTETETFNVTVKNDSILIGQQTVNALASKGTATLTFAWNTTGATIGAHTITAEATAPTDDDLSNNIKTATITIKSSTGPNTDVNGDGKHDMRDIGAVARAYDTHPGDPGYDPNADVNGDGKINIFDIALVAKDFMLAS